MSGTFLAARDIVVNKTKFPIVIGVRVLVCV